MSYYNPQPSYPKGYAHSKSESMAEWMWDGLAGAWVPFLGPTGNLPDQSGEGNHGTFRNMGATDWQGDALNFPGTNESVNIGTPAVLDNLGPLTYIAWIYPRGTGTDHIVMGKREAGGVLRGPYINHTGVDDNVAFFSGFATTNLRRDSSVTILDNVWQQVAVTWDGSVTASNVRIYIDGEEGGYGVTQDGVGGRDDDSGINFVIGSVDDGSARLFNGLIKSVFVFDRILLPKEVQQHYRNSKGLFIRKPRPFVFVPAAVTFVPQVIMI